MSGDPFSADCEGRGTTHIELQITPPGHGAQFTTPQVGHLMSCAGSHLASAAVWLGSRSEC